MNRLLGKDVDITPVGSTTTYGMVELMQKCGAARPLADRDPAAMAKLAIAGFKYAGFEWVKAPGCGVAPQTPLVTIRQLQAARNDYFAKTGSAQRNADLQT